MHDVMIKWKLLNARRGTAFRTFSSMADLSLSPSPSMDPYEFLKIKLNPDGSLTRLNPVPKIPPTAALDLSSETEAAICKDIPLNAANETSIRLFRPHPSPKHKIPVILYFHGGGFVFFSADTAPFHHSCSKMASHLQVLILSVDYRLSPEHRLPAAYEDAVEAIQWLRDQALSVDACDLWLTENADFSRCFLMGSSAGANTVYNARLRSLDLDLSPLKIRGLILNQPYFGGAERTSSEVSLINDPVVPLPATDLMWSLALPEKSKSNRDHEYCNPMGGQSENEKIKRLEWCLVRGYDGDPLIDRQREFSKFLEAGGAHVVAKFYEGGGHAVELFVPSTAIVLYEDMEEFMKNQL